MNPPLVVYQLPQPSGAAAGGPAPLEAANPSSSSVSPLPPSDSTSPGAREADPNPDPAASPSPVFRGSAVVDQTVFSVESSPDGGVRSSGLRVRNDRILRNHPKAEGCLSNALAAMAALMKKGFDLREKVWDGEISLDEGKAVSCQLFKGNEYCFCVGTDAKGAKLSLQFYDRDGTPAEAEASQQTLTEGATALGVLKCHQTGTYFVVVKLEAATQEKVSWGMVSRLPLTVHFCASGMRGASSASEAGRSAGCSPLFSSYSLLSMEGPAMSSTNSSWDLRIGNFSLVVLWGSGGVSCLGEISFMVREDSFAGGIWRPSVLG